MTQVVHGDRCHKHKFHGDSFSREETFVTLLESWLRPLLDQLTAKSRNLYAPSVFTPPRRGITSEFCEDVMENQNDRATVC